MTPDNAYPAAGPAVDLRPSLDRIGNERRDPVFVAALLTSDTTRFALFRGNEPLVGGTDEHPRLRLLDSAALTAAIDVRSAVLLGLRGSERQGLFALSVGLDLPETFAGGRFAPMRASLLDLPPDEAALAAHGAALVHWREQTRFCCRCGHPLEADPSGLVLQCPGCARQHFPRTDPAVIMLVQHVGTDGVARALLARSPRFGERRVLSTLAGFVEPGESLEDALRRETAEEVGIQVEDIAYHSSQPWPFPAQIMLGFTATAIDTELTLDPDEIIEAQWLTRDEIRAERDAGGVGFHLPGKISIARRLIEDWLAAV